MEIDKNKLIKWRDLLLTIDEMSPEEVSMVLDEIDRLLENGDDKEIHYMAWEYDELYFRKSYCGKYSHEGSGYTITDKEGEITCEECKKVAEVFSKLKKSVVGGFTFLIDDIETYSEGYITRKIHYLYDQFENLTYKVFEVGLNELTRIDVVDMTDTGIDGRGEFQSFYL